MNHTTLRDSNRMKPVPANQRHPESDPKIKYVLGQSSEFTRKIELHIDKDVPLPAETVTGLCRRTLLKMNVGDSVLGEFDPALWTMAAAQVGRRVITRKERNKIRAWRVA
jgi:hypothetical protein